jgi:uncharacterized protein (TIGR00299 family) protein
MHDSRFAIIDPACGISGDMLLGALVDLGAGEDWLRGLPDRLGCPDVTVEVGRANRAGIEAGQVTVRLSGGRVEEPAAPLPALHGHEHGHDHQHDSEAPAHAPHRRVSELMELIERAPLSGWVRERAVRAFQLLGEAEGRVHGLPASEVHLHEVGALDALVDIVGGIEGFERLGIRRVYRRPVAIGAGWVRASHGVLSVPAPATGILLEGIEIGPNGPVTGEATTPTGAVLLRVLTEAPPPAHWRAVATGWGAGGRNPAGYSNSLRVMLAEPSAEAGEVVVTATDLDDLSPEYLEPVRAELFRAGALDVQVWMTMAKKGRPGFRLEVVSEPAMADAMAGVLFRQSTTGGVRRWTAGRVTLARRQVEVVTREGHPVRVKVLESPGGVRLKAEYDDVIVAATRSGRPALEIAQEAQQRAQDRVARDAAPPSTAN